jgi:hypothetical protein
MDIRGFSALRSGQKSAQIHPAELIDPYLNINGYSRLLRLVFGAKIRANPSGGINQPLSKTVGDIQMREMFLPRGGKMRRYRVYLSCLATRRR